MTGIPQARVRGIQEDDVWGAADALLAEGLRPTIERVRQKIGRGSPNTVSPLGRALVQQGRLVQADANAIQMEAAKAGVSFIQQLVQVKKLSAKEVSLFAAQTFGYPLLDLNAVDVENLPLNLIDNKVVVTHRVVALGKRGNRMFVGMSDPSNEQVLQRSSSPPA